MTASVVECPECSTLFRVTEAQLSAASGLVRCGACLTIFRAADHRASTPVEVRARMGEEDSDRVQARRHRSVLDAPAPRTTRMRAGRGAGSDSDESAAADASPPRAPGVAPIPEASRDFALDLPPEPGRPATIPLLQAAPDFAEEPGGIRNGSPHRRFRPAPTGRARGASADTVATPAQGVSGALPESLEMEPVAAGVRMRLWRWRWSLAALLVLSVVAGRWLVVNFEALALAPETRGYLTQLCDVVGCELPVRMDIDAIRSQRLLVGADPDRPGGLRAELVLINRAEWPQPFPDLELRFSTIRGEPVASERLSPGEYLAGELTGVSEMPPGNPIRIALQLADPGEEAVNYELRLYPSEP